MNIIPTFRIPGDDRVFQERNPKRKVKIDFGTGELVDAQLNYDLIGDTRLILDIFDKVKGGLRGAKMICREFKNLQDVLSLDCNNIFNCTGLGSYHLFNDKNMYPIKGQIIYYKKNQIDYNLIYDNKGFYQYIHPDKILIGGVYNENDWNVKSDEKLT